MDGVAQKKLEKIWLMGRLEFGQEVVEDKMCRGWVGDRH